MARPRIHPDGTTAAERVIISVYENKRAGGDRKSFLLRPEANAALQALCGSKWGKNGAEVVNALLVHAARQLRKRSDDGNTSSQSVPSI